MSLRKTLIALAAVAGLALTFAVATGSASAHGGNHYCKKGDPWVLASWRTSCPFALNIGSAFYQGKRGSVWVNSPETHRWYRVAYRWRYANNIYGGLWVTATGANGIWVKFYYEN